ncbi:MAG: TerB family tellurite resistance protein [Bacteroidia bacterium]
MRAGVIIGAIVGFIIFRKFWGAFIGAIVGSYVDSFLSEKKSSERNTYEPYRQRISQSDFSTALLLLSASVMKADGKILKAELDYVKTFFVRQFGENNATRLLLQLREILKTNVSYQNASADIRNFMTYEVRMQLLHYLFGIAQADGAVSEKEVNLIQLIANSIGLSSADFNSIKAMFYKDVDASYKILGIDTSSTNEEIKKAYRSLAIKFHPDKVTHLGEEYQNGAKEKFQKIQDAYEHLKKQRGFA